MLFDSQTGETHFLSELPYLVLCALGGKSRTLTEIANSLAGPEALDSSALEKIGSALVYLERAEIVESGECPQN